MSETITFGDIQIPVQVIPPSWNGLNEEQIAAMLRSIYGTAAKIVTTEDGRRTVTWVVPQVRA